MIFFWWKILFLSLYQVESTQLFMCLFASKRLHFAMVKALHVGDRTTDQKKTPTPFIDFTSLLKILAERSLSSLT